MKIRKLLAAACGCFALLSGATAARAADTVAEVGGAKYETLEAALGALDAQNSRLTLLSDAAWDAATPVYWKAGTKSGYAATLLDGLKSAFMADGGAITIVCRPGADVGEMTHGHVADDITIYGNKAYVSGGECDLEVDTYTVSRETEAQSSESGLAKDISITAYGLDNLGVWGERKTAHVVTISLNDCDGRVIDGVSDNAQRVFLSGEKAGVNNITLTDCDFITTLCAVYSSVDGSLKVENCTFKNVHEPININHKTAGPMTVEVVGTTFTSCGTAGSNYAAPVRVVNSGAGTMSASVAACTFTDTVGANGDVLVGDGRDGKTSNAVSLTVSGTAANVQTQQPGCYATDDFTILDATKRATKTVASTATVTATIDGTFKLTAIDFDAFIAALEDSNYVLDGSAHELAQDGRLTVKWSPASGCRDERANHTCTAGGVKATGNTPHRLNAGLLQFQMFDGKDCAVSVKNVDFVYEPADCTVCANSGWAGTFTAAQASAGQIFIESAGDVAFENCTFDKTVLTSWGCTGATTVRNCTFKNVYDSYAVKDVRGETVEVTGCTFTDCGGAVMVSAADATKVTRVAVSTNAFENVDVADTAVEDKVGTRGLVQIAAGGDYSGAQFVFAGNVAKNCGPVVRQLNATVAFNATAKSDLSALVSDGQSLYTSDSKKPAVAKVGDIQYFSLAEALNAALAANDGVKFTTVEIVDDITFAEGDAWTPVAFGQTKRLEIVGNGKKIVNLPNSLLAPAGNSLQRLRVSNLTFVDPKAENPNDYASAVIYGYADVLGEAAFNNVCIDGAKVSAKKHAGAFLGYVSLHDAEEKVTFTNCKVTNSRITSAEGSVGALAGHANGSYVGTVEVVDCEVVGNTIGYTTADEDGAIKAGAVFGSIGNAPVSVSANVSGNTVTAVGETVTTIYGRQGSAGGRLTLTGGTYDSAPFAEADAEWAGVSVSCAVSTETVGGKTVYTVAETAVATVGGTAYASLADAIEAALALNDGTPVEIQRDVTFAPGDAWTPPEFGGLSGRKLVINGNGKTISNMHGSLLGSHDLTVDAWNGSLTVTNLKFVDPKDSYTASERSGAAVILPCAYGMDVTMDGVVIEGADIRAGTDSYVAGFVAWCNGPSGGGKKNVTLKNCAIRNSTLVSCGSVGGLVAYTTATPDEAVTLVVENCEVTGNTIVGTEIKNGAPRTDIVGSVVATIGAGGASVSAKVTGNSVYGSASAFDAETLTKEDAYEVTTVYGRNQAGGTLTVTGGEYDHAPFAGDATWASVAEWSKIVEQDGVYKVVDNPVTLGNVAARQRYPWNGLVDVTFELKSQKEVRLFIVAEYANGAETVRLPMAAAKLVNEDGAETDVNVSDGSFKMAAQETAKTVHVVWDSTTAVPARQSGVTFKVYAK